MNRKSMIAWLLVLAALASVLPAAADDGPLESFGALVIGEWEAEDSRHVLEWGVGQRTIRSRSYFKSEDEWTLAGEGMWYWDPAQKTIRGVAVAVGMPVELFEYRSRVRDGEVVHDLVAQGAAGGEYVERWTFADDEYRWTLEVEKEGGLEPIMGGVYQRAGAQR